MNKKQIFAVVLMAGLFTACSSDHDEVARTSSSIRITTQIEGVTRVSTQADGTQIFDDGDQISVYAWTGDAGTAPAADNRVVDNSINTLTNGTWVPSPQMLWKNTTDKHYFIGIYPKSDTPHADLTSVPYTLNVGNEMESDMLVAVNTTGIVSTYTPVPLVFDHVMSRLLVNLTFRNQWATTPTVEKLTVRNAATQATVNCLTKITTASDNGRTDLALPAVQQNTNYASVMVPQTGVRTIAITIDGKDYTYNHTSDIALEEGKYTTVSLIVGRDSISLGSVSINDWQKGTEITGGEAQ